MAVFDSVIPMIPGLPPVPQKPSDWADWSDRVLEHRVKMAYLGQIDEYTRALEARKCKKSFLYCAATYGFIYEARGDDFTDEEDDYADGYIEDEDFELSTPLSGGVIPFIPYPFQIETAYWAESFPARSRASKGRRPPRGSRRWPRRLIPVGGEATVTLCAI